MGEKHHIKEAAIASIITVVLFAASIAAARQSTFNPAYKVCINSANSENIEIALNAVQKAYDFFIDIGYFEKYFLEIIFQKAVMVEIRSDKSIRVYGKLGKDNQIYLTDWNEPWLAGQNSYGLRMNKEFYESLIVHEAAHFIAEKIARRKIENTLSEYIAYIVQLSQMPAETRQTILSRHPLSSFETDEINLDVMMFDPAVFAVKSYLHFKKSKGQYLKDILSGATQEPNRVAYWQFH